MNIFNFFNIQNNSNLNIPKVDLVKKLLNEIITPFMNELGLNNWNKNYIWSSDYNSEGIKHIFYYTYGNKLSGTFQFGNNFNFIPSIDNKIRVIINKDELQLFERNKHWHLSFEKKVEKEFYVSHWNEYFLRKSLKKMLDIEKNNIEKWFVQNNDLYQNIDTAINQINTGGAYDLNSPNQKFILAFLYAKIGKLDIGIKTLEEFYEPRILSNISEKTEFEIMVNKLGEIKNIL